LRPLVIRQDNALPQPTADVVQGTLDLLILKTISLTPMHGWGIAQRIQQLTQDVLQVNQGSLYPAVHRLEGKRLIASEWAMTENGRRAKYYRLTSAGKKQLARELESWEVFTGAVRLILRAS